MPILCYFNVSAVTLWIKLCAYVTCLERCSVRYMSVLYLRWAISLACSYSYANNGMYRAFNAVFGKVGRVASPDVVVHLVKTKCPPILYYAIEVWPTKSDVFLSLQYVIDTCFKNISHNNITFIARSAAHEANKQTNEQADRWTDRQKQTTSTNCKPQ